MPSQKKTFPNVFLFLIHFVLLMLTSCPGNVSMLSVNG